MNKLSLEQRRAFAGFWAQLAVAWLVSGFVIPYLTGNLPVPAEKIVTSLAWSGLSIWFMLDLTGKDKK